MKNVKMTVKLMEKIMDDMGALTCTAYPECTKQALLGDKKALAFLNQTSRKYIQAFYNAIEELDNVAFYVDMKEEQKKGDEYHYEF